MLSKGIFREEWSWRLKGLKEGGGGERSSGMGIWLNEWPPLLYGPCPTDFIGLWGRFFRICDKTSAASLLDDEWYVPSKQQYKRFEWADKSIISSYHGWNRRKQERIEGRGRKGFWKENVFVIQGAKRHRCRKILSPDTLPCLRSFCEKSFMFIFDRVMENLSNERPRLLKGWNFYVCSRFFGRTQAVVFFWSVERGFKPSFRLHGSESFLLAISMSELA